MAKYYESRNEFDGFNEENSTHPYDDKKEKHFQADIWFLLAGLSFLIFISSCYLHFKERHLINNGICIEAEYHTPTMTATYFDENGKYHNYDISSFSPVMDGDIIRLYYMQDIAKAVPENTLISWIGIHLFFIVLFAFSMWRVLSVYCKKSHIS